MLCSHHLHCHACSFIWSIAKHTGACGCYSNLGPGPCITNVFATRRKNFSQWHRSFQRKLLSHWLKFLRHVAITLVIQGPGTWASAHSEYAAVGGHILALESQEEFEAINGKWSIDIYLTDWKAQLCSWSTRSRLLTCMPNFLLKYIFTFCVIFFYIGLAHVVENLFREQQRAVYSTKWIFCLLVTWQHKDLGHQPGPCQYIKRLSQVWGLFLML